MRTLQRAAVSALVASSIAAALPALAQSPDGYPNRPVRIIVPFTPGSASDIEARRLAPKMAEHLGQPMVVENHPGAGGTAGANIVARAAPDGYTLMLWSSAFAVSAALYKKLPYDPAKDFAPVGLVAVAPQVLVVAPSLGVKSIEDLLKMAKANPGKLNFGSSGIGSATHFNGEQFKSSAGIDVVHVPFKGPRDALLETATGRIQYFWAPLIAALPFIKDGRLLPLAVSTKERTPALPNVPTVAETALPGYEFQDWFGMFAPGGTPEAVVSRLNVELARVLALPDVKKQMIDMGELPGHGGSADFSVFIHREIDKATQLVKVAGVPRQ
jgi:tripartite-type tricarboxylate transporter receptor subunit TctC